MFRINTTDLTRGSKDGNENDTVLSEYAEEQTDRNKRMKFCTDNDGLIHSIQAIHTIHTIFFILVEPNSFSNNDQA